MRIQEKSPQNKSGLDFAVFDPVNKLSIFHSGYHYETNTQNSIGRCV